VDVNFKKFKAAMQRNKFNFNYAQYDFQDQVLESRQRPALLRVRSKLQKIDMALKVVLRRVARKNNVNYQENLAELESFLESIEQQQDSPDGR
jgi:hypothetical protein